MNETITKEIDPTEIDDIATIIGFVLNFEYERTAKIEDPSRITLTRNTAQHSPWRLAGLMRSMSARM